ncbi:uncharacterized protein PHACADRAFT_189401 [Phanerochaete carnosa HHB-10118-sp]|uniref:Uncharacterized protein n=1 Tax=Phanerochaete carnosa (strain HHB-10118-sp) TaxID=650164 RepID=K5VBI7_PHACS|nr:uncharacterized protein PHACADRAFT_189401 [Phanerochaete carnosa HHB-10118-sp]EKM60266.1 hypothetical protein PHACADRAFT_189401 [Phanerochaete carnosa HHB-10118-sp]
MRRRLQKSTSLPRLRQLYVDDDFGYVIADVLEHTLYPASTSMSFEVTRLNDSTVFIVSAPTPCPIFMPKMTPSGLSSSRNRRDDSRQPSVWRSTAGRLLSRCGNIETSAEFVAALFARLLLTDVRTALLTEPTVSGRIRWQDVFKRLPLVRALGLEYSTSDPICLRVPSAVTCFGRNDVLFPDLTSVRQWESHCELPLYFNKYHTSSDLHLLASYLASRQRDIQ